MQASVKARASQWNRIRQTIGLDAGSSGACGGCSEDENRCSSLIQTPHFGGSCGGTDLKTRTQAANNVKRWTMPLFEAAF